MPQVVGRSLEDAAAALQAAGLRPGEQVRRVRGTVWAGGRVLATRPRAGTPADAGAIVELTVAADCLMRPHEVEA